MDRKRFLPEIPDQEGKSEKDAEYNGAYLKRHAEPVGQVVRDERSEDADERHGKPVQGGDIFLCAELEEERNRQENTRDDRRAHEPEVQVYVQEVRGRLADRGAEHLDDPEEDGYFRHLAQQVATPVRHALSA